jgi:hypothetical protein
MNLVGWTLFLELLASSQFTFVDTGSVQEEGACGGLRKAELPTHAITYLLIRNVVLHVTRDWGDKGGYVDWLELALPLTPRDAPGESKGEYCF